MGYKALKIELTDQESAAETGTNAEVLENNFYRLIIDKSTGRLAACLIKS